eukprot:5869442-Pyramimonas_sp.AAC.1
MMGERFAKVVERLLLGDQALWLKHFSAVPNALVQCLKWDPLLGTACAMLLRSTRGLAILHRTSLDPRSSI